MCNLLGWGKIVSGVGELIVAEEFGAAVWGTASIVSGAAQLADSGEPAPSTKQRVPQDALNTLAGIDSKKSPFPKIAGGRPYLNDGRSNSQILPQYAGVKKITYQEWDIDPKPRTARRWITGSDGSAWYTEDHYVTCYEYREGER